MNVRKRALSVNSQAGNETQTEMKKLKGNDMHMQPQAITQRWDMGVDSNYAAQEHRYDGPLSFMSKYKHLSTRQSSSTANDGYACPIYKLCLLMICC